MIDMYGYETAPQERTFNTYEDVDCFHSAGLHDYIKFMKYGYGKATDHAVREIRLKRMTREEGIEMVRKYDDKKPKDLSVFLNWIGMTEQELYDCVDPWRDSEIWDKDKNGKWHLRDSVINHVNDNGVDSVRLEKTEDCEFIITPSREPDELEDRYVLMGRGYIDKYNFKAVSDDQDEIQKRLDIIQKEIKESFTKANNNMRNLNADISDEISDDDYKATTSLKYCARCVMPNTKPGVRLDEEGICNACRSVEKKKDIDWRARHREFKKLCDSIRGTNGNGYDCLVPVSGGKDSHYQVWMMKVVHRMNPLSVCVVPHLQTREGIANLNNLVEAFNVDLIKVSLKPSVFKALRRKAFFKMGYPAWADHCSAYGGVARIASMYQIPLTIWGEDVAVEFGGKTAGKRVASAEDIMNNDLIKNKSIKDFYDDIVTPETSILYRAPSKEERSKKRIRSLYLGYYYNWDGYKHYRLAKRYGFRSRQLGCLLGNILNYDNIDEKLSEFSIWFKFLKFGFWRPTDQACYHIWNGRISREEAIKLVNAKQYEFPAEYFKDFLEFHGITEEDFWRNAEKFRNRNIWHKVNGEWRLKIPLIQQPNFSRVS